MFCYQCEQTAGGTGCTKGGVCGKSPDIQSMQDILLFGLKGIAAYAYHARELGYKDEEVDAFMHEGLFKTITNVNFNFDQYVEIVLRCGKVNLKVMELLDTANTARFGNPMPMKVFTGTRAGKGILVTGHDLLDLYELLRQTEGKGINVYTHGEMLPAHGYPELRKFKHLVGNYGGAWQEQKKEFNEFGGALLITTNCVLTPPAGTYLDRLFTAGVTGVASAAHIKNRDFSAVIEKALALPDMPESEGVYIQTGFHHVFLTQLLDKIVGLVKAGKIKHFFLIGGCDGAKPGRDYYTRFAEAVPNDCLILTLACGKYRFNKRDFGQIDGIPRLIDLGQCNNAYSAILVAAALSKAFGVGINDLPLTLVLSWFEQKAVAILLTLLSLNVRGIRLGPTPPAFITENVFKFLKKEFDLRLIGDSPEEDLKTILAGK